MKLALSKAINNISSMDELNEAIDLIKIKQKQLRAMKTLSAKSSISVGSKVKITSKSGVEFGVVETIKRTKAIVSIDGIRYNCPISLLEVA
jgi:hypothetical protein